MSFGVTTSKNVTTVLTGDGFWPDLAVAEFLELYRLPAEYAEALLADHLDLARLWAVGHLAKWRSEQEAKGRASLEDVPVSGLPGGATRLFKRAVYCRAKGLLLQQFATIERREAARNDAKEAPETTSWFLSQADAALAALTGRTFITVEAV